MNTSILHELECTSKPRKSQRFEQTLSMLFPEVLLCPIPVFPLIHRAHCNSTCKLRTKKPICREKRAHAAVLGAKGPCTDFHRYFLSPSRLQEKYKCSGRRQFICDSCVLACQVHSTMLFWEYLSHVVPYCTGKRDGESALSESGVCRVSDFSSTMWIGEAFKTTSSHHPLKK